MISEIPLDSFIKEVSRAETNEIELSNSSCARLQIENSKSLQNESQFKASMDMVFWKHKEQSSDMIPFHWQGELRGNGDTEKQDDQSLAENGKILKNNKSNTCEKNPLFKDEMEDQRTCERDCGSFLNSSSNHYKNSRKSVRYSISQSSSNACMGINGLQQIPHRISQISYQQQMSPSSHLRNQFCLGGSNIQGSSYQQNSFQQSDTLEDARNKPAAAIMEYLAIKDKKPLKRNFLKQIYYVRKITNILKQRLNKLLFHQLQQIHFDVINDQSYFFTPQETSSQASFTAQLVSFQRFLSNIFHNVGTFSPDSMPVMAWNTMILIMQFFQLVIYPLKSSFATFFFSQNENQYLYNLPLILGALEIVLHLNFSFYEHGVLIKQHSLIFQRYMMKKFPFDLVCMGLLYIASFHDYFPLDLLFAIFSLKKIFFNLRSINEHFQIEQRFQTFYDLANLTCLVFYMAHYCACGFYYVGTLQTDNWINYYHFSHLSWFHNYINSLYFTFITMVTVGFGDIAPTNILEKIYVIFMTIVACGVFAYAVNTIGRIFSDMALKSANYKNRKFEITKFMRQRNTSKKIQRSVLKYIEYEHGQELENFQKGEEILQEISKSLRDEVNREYFSKFLLDIKLFKLNFSLEFIMHLSSYIKERSYGPNEIIYSQGDIDRNFYFICKGTIQLYLDKKNQQLREDEFNLIIAAKGQLLGLNSFMTGNPKDVSAKSINACHLIYCSEHDFLQTIRQYEQDYEKYCMLRDSINLYKDHQGLPCMSCGKFDHQARNCTLFNLRIDKEFVNLRHIYSPYQERSGFERKGQRKPNSLSTREHVCMSLRKIRLSYVRLIYEISCSSISSNSESFEKSSPSISSQSSSEEKEEEEGEEEEQLEVRDNQLSGINCSAKSISEKVIKSYKSTSEKAIRQYKSDKEFYMSVKPLRLRDLQLYLISMGIITNSDSQRNLDSSMFSVGQVGSNRKYFDEEYKQYTDQEIPFSKSSLSRDSSPSIHKIQQRKNSIYSPHLQQSVKGDQIGIFPPSPQLKRKTSSNKNGENGNQQGSTIIQSKGLSKKHSGVYSTFGMESDGVLSQINPSSRSIKAPDEDALDARQKVSSGQEIEGAQSRLLSVKPAGNPMETSRLKRTLSVQPHGIFRANSLLEDNSKQNLPPLVQINSSNGGANTNLHNSNSTAINAINNIFQQEQVTTAGQILPRPIVKQRPNGTINMQAVRSSLFQNSNQHEIPANHLDIFQYFDRYHDFICYFPAFNISLVLKEQRKKAYQVLMVYRLNKIQAGPKQQQQQQSNETSTFSNLPKKQSVQHSVRFAAARRP